MTKDQKLENEVEKLTTEIDNALKLSNSHENRVRSELSKEKDDGQEETKVEEAKGGNLETPSVQSETRIDQPQISSSTIGEGEPKQGQLRPTDNDPDPKPVDSRI